MNTTAPLVTVGVLTFNRAKLLVRALESALHQTYKNIEVIVSDNASSDNTEQICEAYSKKYQNFKYIRQSKNIGAAANFEFVANQAQGEYFMLLGDDDWIDLNYVEICIAPFLIEKDISLVSGAPEYYKNGIFSYSGKIFQLDSYSAFNRVLNYYWNVTDNGMFYGIFKTDQIRGLRVENLMGCDWFMIAATAMVGRIKMLPAAKVHRELGGATSSYRNIVRALSLPRFQGWIPFVVIAFGAARSFLDFDFSKISPVSGPKKFIFAFAIFATVIAKRANQYLRFVLRPASKLLKGRPIQST